MRHSSDLISRKLLSRSVEDKKTPILHGKHCRRWLRGRGTKYGHGQMWDGEKTQFVHRLAFELANGHMPAMVLHDCGNGWCIEPEHLKSGDHKMNGADMVRHGRSQLGAISNMRGVGHPKVKLTEEQARYVLDSPEKTTAELCRELSVSDSLIRGIRKGRNWKWLNPARG